MFDAGCAHGFLVEALWDRGVEARGRDISAFAISQVRPDVRAYCATGSIADPITGHYDLVTCIEVLEHMNEPDAIQAIAEMTKVTDRILFSSSPNDFAEPAHVNVKPMLYWLRLFAAQGFAPRPVFDGGFVAPQAVVLERSAEGRRDEDLAVCAELGRTRLACADRDRSLREFSQQNTSLVQRAEAAESAFVKARQGAEATAAELVEARQRAEATAAELVEARQRADAAATDLMQARQRADAVAAELKRANAESVDLAAALAAIERRAQQAVADVGTLHAELAHLSAAYHGVLGSTTWRITAPLRNALSRWPRLRRALRSTSRLFWRCATLRILRLDGSPGKRRRGAAGVQWIFATASPRLLAKPAVRRLAVAAIVAGRRGRLWRVLRRSQRIMELSKSVVAELAGQIPVPAAALPEAANYVPPVGLLPGCNPLSIRLARELADRPALNVLVPALGMKNMTGGPNTAVNLAYRLAALGVPIRLVSADMPIDPDPKAFWRHVRALADIDAELPNVELVDASDRTQPLTIGANDVFMATAWWTAQMAKYAISHTRHQRFLYLIQEYEPLLHPSSTPQALAEETYRLDHIPIVNTTLLRDFLATERVGPFADPEFAERAIVFEPAINISRFYPDRMATDGLSRRRRLLLYARPRSGVRNAFELGVAALQKLIFEGAFDPAEWEFLGMGDPFAAVDLGRGAQLVSVPWLDFDSYARQMRTSDLLLSPMLSPHPSYPPLEMAASGRPVVTTTFATKTAARLAAISPNIIGVEPTIEAIADGLREAIRRQASGIPNSSKLGLPSSWSESFAATVPAVHDALLGLFGAPPLGQAARRGDAGPVSGLFPGYRQWPGDRYGLLRFDLLHERRQAYGKAAVDAGLLSFLTPVWNTPADMLRELAQSVLGQDAGTGFEWIILDNGTDRDETRAALAPFAEHPCVRLFRVEANLGIAGGMRYCLERATGRYIVPLDSDDLLTPDCVRVVTSELISAGYPALAYTDEDKVEGTAFRDPYCKPDWDPVLFAHSCYIAHLCAIDRRLAIELGAYTDAGASGSHDWDTFVRFFRAGHTPHHIRHILYSWRLHAASTAANIGSKDYIFSSQRAVLERFLAGAANPGRYRVDPSPLFNGTPDWRFLRPADEPVSIATILIGGSGEPIGVGKAFSSGAAAVERISADDGLETLLTAVEKCAGSTEFIHLLHGDVVVEETGWANEAAALCELFPDTLLVGGRIHRAGQIVDADRYFGFGEACNSPNRGRSLADPGYFAQMWKPHSVSAVPLQHCVARADFLVAALRRLAGTGASYHHLAAWLGAEARRRGGRVVYSPFFCARIAREIEAPTTVERDAFVMAHRALIPEPTLLSLRLGLSAATVYQPLLARQRRDEEKRARSARATSYADSAAAEVMARRITSPAPPRSCRFSLLTSVYERTSAALFEETARSLTEQSYSFAEWLVLENGPVSPEVADALQRLAADPRIRLFRVPDNLGIVRAMRFCLERASGDYVIPMDADDLLTGDALQQLALAIAASPSASLFFSDEDLLVEQQPTSPFRRPGFDPILNAADSYIWHLCAFRRERALALDAFSDSGANYCHDWDTACRFAAAGDEIVHVPAVLYHWRRHLDSSSNRGEVNPGSLASVKHVMTGIIARQPRPELYDVDPFPLYRGVEQYAIRRRPVDPMLMALVVLAEAEPTPASAPGFTALACTMIGEPHVLAQWREPSAAARLARLTARITADHVALIGDALTPDTEHGVWEAMRLFEMHPDVAAVGGRIIGEGGTVLGYCAVPAFDHGALATAAGGQRGDPGPFAMALKPQSAMRIAGEYFFCRTELLREAATALAEDGGSLTGLGERLTALIHARGMRIAYSPLIEATLSDHGAEEQVAPKPLAKVLPTGFGVAGIRGRRTAVVYLARKAEGLEPVKRFVASYRAHNPGEHHDLAVVYKGYDGGDDIARTQAVFDGMPHRTLNISDEGFDIGAYLFAARQLDYECLCFLNTFTEIVAEAWLATLCAQAARAGVGIVGATGSYESLHDSCALTGKAVWLCAVKRIPFDERIAGHFRWVLADHAAEWMERRAAPGKRPGRVAADAGRPYRAALDSQFPSYWEAVCAPGGPLEVCRQMPRFPNPHIRSNCFMIARSLLLSLGYPPPQTKNQCYEFESGFNGLTARLRAAGLSALVAGRDGIGYDVPDWPQSRTFRLESQDNLLAIDNQVREFASLCDAERITHSRFTWGDYLGPAPPDFPDLGFTFARGDLAPARIAAAVARSELSDMAV